VTLLMVPALYAIGVDIAEFRSRTRQRVVAWFTGRKPSANKSVLDQTN